MPEKKITNQFHNKPDTSLLAMPSFNGPISNRPTGKLPDAQMPNAQKSLKLNAIVIYQIWIPSISLALSHRD